MVQYLADTYLIVLIAVQEMNSANYRIKLANLVQQLHEIIKEMHIQNLVLHLNSCLKETIYSAIGRYIVLGLI